MTFATLGVIGAGTMGHGIAHVSALAGATVHLYDTDAARVAAVLREVLEEAALVGWPKSSGGRGIHVMVPIRPEWDFVATRRAVMRAARRRGSSTTISPSTAPERARICGTCVVLPLPVAAVSTIAPPRMHSTIRSAARSTGSGSRPASLVASPLTCPSACGSGPRP